MKEAILPTSEPSWIAEWIARAAELPPQRSIILGSKCCADLKYFGRSVANYLNEFDENAGGHWAAFDYEDLRHLAGDAACRDLLLSSDLRLPVEDSPEVDFDRVVRRLARIGGAVLEGAHGLEAAGDLDTVYRVCLCSDHPCCLHPCDIWLNRGSFTTPSLVAVIADSFLDWCARRPDYLVASRNDQLPANGAEQDPHRCASL